MWWGGIAALIAVGFAVWSYYRLPVRIPKGWLYLLGALRAGAVWALLFLLAEPILTRYFEQEEKPLVLLLADNSESVFWKGSFSLTEYVKGIQDLQQSLEAKGLRVESYAFDEKLRPKDSLNGKGQVSQISLALRQALEAHPQAAAAVLLSDGRETGEGAPLYSEIPIWTVSVGPSAPIADLYVESVEIPPYVTEKEEIPIQLRLRNADHPSMLTVRYPGGQQRFPIPARTQQYRLKLPPLPVGFHALRFELDDPADPNPANNQRTALIEVQPERVSIYLWAGEITPDIAFLRARLERLGQVRLIAARKPAGYTTSPDTLRWRSHDLHVLYNFPARPEDEMWAEKLLAENAFLLLSWGAVEPREVILQKIGLKSWGDLMAYPLSNGAAIYLQTRDYSSEAQPIDLGWSRPIGYKFYRGNRLLTLLAGEGWWQLRTSPAQEERWDSVFFSLLQEGLRLQRSRWLFAPRRSTVAPGEAVIWSGFLPKGATLSIGGTTLPLQTEPDGTQKALWVPDTPGVYPYVVKDKATVLFSGAILVESRSPELQTLGRDTTYLAYIARLTGGRYWSWENRSSFADSLRATLPVSAFLTSQRLTISFHEWSLWLILILSLLSVEWLLRRYVGLY
ncbi:MAG: hypothetical protein NZ989_02930 [Bacteroidia bacterium]|nr:hypothetical protein [Bacteroidia bacterium]MDW8057638.1 hypothetical protein [Bacteroidia bacterium]